MFRVKICGITSIDDALAAADAGADAIGLNFFRESRRFVDAEIARRIVAALPSAVLKVGVFVNHSTSEIAEMIDEVNINVVQLHGDEPQDLIARLPQDVRVVRSCRGSADGFEKLSRSLEHGRLLGRLPHAVLIDADSPTDFGGTAQLADWQLIAQRRVALAGLPLILAGGLTPNNVSAAIVAVRPSGVDVASGVERQPGMKDHDLMAKFVAAAREAFERV